VLTPYVNAPSSITLIGFNFERISVAFQSGHKVSTIFLDTGEHLILIESEIDKQNAVFIQDPILRVFSSLVFPANKATFFGLLAMALVKTATLTPVDPPEPRLCYFLYLLPFTDVSCSNACTSACMLISFLVMGCCGPHSCSASFSFSKSRKGAC